eukprot:scpid58576/ scgid0727/ 
MRMYAFRSAAQLYYESMASSALIDPCAGTVPAVEIQKANGVKLIKGCDSSHKAREFVRLLSATMQKKIASIISSSTAFSVLSDGLQARKTRSEKELVLVRLVKEGEPVFFTLALMNVDDYGDATANNLKTAIDDSFRGEVH